MENEPFEDVFPIENGDFQIIAIFDYWSVDECYWTMFWLSEGWEPKVPPPQSYPPQEIRP